MNKANRRLLPLMTLIVTCAAALGCGTLSPLPQEPSTPTNTPIPTPTLPLPENPIATPTSAPLRIEAVNELEQQIVAVYESAGPAVVNIASLFFVEDEQMRPIPQGGTGTGFLYDAEGHIVTNYHVVENAELLIVTMADGTTYPAVVVGEDPSTDLAVIHIDTPDLPNPVPLGDSDALHVGQFVVAIGNPFGQQGTLTFGVVSALERVIESPDGRFIGKAIQTDAAVNPGNSGGPLLDLDGRVVGVNSQIVSPSQASAGIGFAVPVNTVKRVASYLIAIGRYPHPWLGVRTYDLSPGIAEVLRQAGADIPVDFGLMVIDVIPNSPADQGGIEASTEVLTVDQHRVPIGGDIIVALNNQPVRNMQELAVYLENETAVGDTISVSVMRGRAEKTIEVTLGQRPGE